VSVDDLSPTLQEYLKIIRGAAEWSSAPVTVSALARRLAVSPSSASEAVQRLADLGHVEHARYGHIELTATGDHLALAIIRRHRLIESFLVTVLGYEWHEVDGEADRLEHAVSDRLVERLDHLLGRPPTDPHGDPIPTAEGVMPASQSYPLDQATVGQRVRLARVSDSDARLLQQLDAGDLGLGDLATVAERSDGLGTISLTDGSRSLVLALTAARSILVDPA
jgi:DtxR family Mn-dependent transcriptional regulator